VDDPGKDGNASMPEQVKRPNPWMNMMMIMIMMMMMMTMMHVKQNIKLNNVVFE
jgi:hypothetical protein